MEEILLAVEAFTAIVFIGLSFPLILRKVPPNHWYGVRVKKTLNNADIWYEANAYFGKDLLIAGLSVLTVCVLLFFVQDMMTLNTFLLTVSTVLLVPYIVAVLKSLLHLRKMEQPPANQG